MPRRTHQHFLRMSHTVKQILFFVRKPPECVAGGFSCGSATTRLGTFSNKFV